jgi:hypothetical protein
MGEVRHNHATTEFNPDIPASKQHTHRVRPARYGKYQCSGSKGILVPRNHAP